MLAAAVSRFGAMLTMAIGLCAPASAQEVVLRVGDQVGAERARLEAAGLLDNLPYHIEWSVYPAAVNLHEALKAGAIDIGSSADSPAVSAIAGGSKIRIAAAFNNGGKGTSILVPKDSDIQTISDLRGKTISPTTRGSVSHYLVLGALKKAGITPSEVTLAFLAPTDASAAFQAGSIDAWGTWGIYTARTTGVLGARILLDGQGINSGYSVYAATEEALADPARSAAIADYADRMERAYAWSRDHREEFLDFYAAFTKQKREVVEPMFDEQTSYTRRPIDDKLAADLQQVFATWVEAGVLSGDLDLSKYIEREPLKVVSQ
ncbi:ABC transporter substrate-binding protein [Paracoccus laeviglucosivorans]|uniref:Putative aliphatic sulfonates-binding protein n=1 Tax=Paracoccus laeviglucosivorans TaxID=1197861 RepID=A0A521FKZ5_9RHOB|nr:ABC transporter substrate-binding protein [Paracoccus laeviglucosivorans]SMO96724.1 sulfonate transport system substrate-binding protein [Paracoccus laeviglucosivorans]